MRIRDDHRRSAYEYPVRERPRVNEQWEVVGDGFVDVNRPAWQRATTRTRRVPATQARRTVNVDPRIANSYANRPRSNGNAFGSARTRRALERLIAR